MAELVAIEGLLEGLILNLEEGDEWTMGRDPDLCRIILEDAKTSRKHLVIRKVDNHYILENLSITNPVIVNGQIISQEIELNDQDEIIIGGNTFRFYREKREISLEEPSALEEKETIFREEDVELPESSIDLRLDSRFILKVISGPNTGAEYALGYSRDYLIGSDSSCDLVFHDLSVSRQHARFFIDEEGKMFIEDLNSRNGVVIDREKIEGKRALLPNIIVTLGTSSFLIIDKEAPTVTIISPEIVTQKEEKITESPSTGKAARIAEVIKKSSRLRGPHLIFSLIFVGLIFLLGIGALSLFHESQLHNLAPDFDSEIKKALQPFKAVQFTYNPCSGKLFLAGHVLNDIEKKELIYNLQCLSFIKGVDDNIVVDDAIWQEMNLLFSKYPDFEGVSLRASEAGKFVLTGYLKSLSQKAALNDFMNHNFLYMNLLENLVIVEEEANKEIRSKLVQKGFGGVVPALSQGVLTLTGSIKKDQVESFAAFLEGLTHVSGVKNIQNFVLASENSSDHAEILQGYHVTGFSKYGDININVVINGKILMRGDVIDGYVIHCIQPHAIFFEKDGLKYKLEYNK